MRSPPLSFYDEGSAKNRGYERQPGSPAACSITVQSSAADCLLDAGIATVYRQSDSGDIGRIGGSQEYDSCIQLAFIALAA